MASLTPAAAPLGANTIDFQTVEGFAAGAVVLGNTMRFGFQYAGAELDNGVDDDNNGLIDDGQLVFVRNLGEVDETTTVLATGIPELHVTELANGIDDNGNGLIDECGVAFELSGREFRIWMSMQGVGPGGTTLSAAFETKVALMND